MNDKIGNAMSLSVVEIVGSPLCVATDDGQRVHDRVAPVLRHGGRLSLSFRNAAHVSCAFLNAAIGQLYGEFSEEEIRRHVQFADIVADDSALIERVIANARIYFRDRPQYAAAVREVAGDQSDERNCENREPLL